MKSKWITIGIMTVATTMLSACQSMAENTADKSATPPVQSGVCERNAAASLVGKQRVTDEQAMQATGASQVRQVKPGQPVTMDYRKERVTIETDPATGKITRAACG